MKLEKAVIKNHEMTDSMKYFAIKHAIDSMEEVETDKDLAYQLKNGLEIEYPGNWHVIVG